MVNYLKQISFFFINFPLYHVSRCQGFYKFLWTIYRSTDTIGRPPLAYNHQSTNVYEKKTGQSVDKEH